MKWRQSSEIFPGLTNMNIYPEKPLIEHLPLSKMKYETYIDKVKGNAILINNYTKMASIDPDYKHNLREALLSPEYCEEEITWADIAEILHLEVEYWNRINSKLNVFLERTASMLNDELSKTIATMVGQTLDQEKAEKEKADDMIKSIEVS